MQDLLSLPDYGYSVCCDDIDSISFCEQYPSNGLGVVLVSFSLNGYSVLVEAYM